MILAAGIKTVAQPLRHTVHVLQWRREYREMSTAGSLAKTQKMHFPAGKTLMIVPHADDEIFGAYAYIKANPKTDLYYMGFTGSNSDDSNKKTRGLEFASSAAALGLTYYLRENDPLSDILSRNRYDIILCPSMVDWHEEHRVCSRLLLEELTGTDCDPTFYWYCVTVPIMTTRETVCIPMTKAEQKEKYDLFKSIYKSQNFMPVERFALQERLNAIGTDYYACELLYRITCEELKKQTIRLYKSESGQRIAQELNDMKMSISKLQKIRAESEKAYAVLERE